LSVRLQRYSFPVKAVCQADVVGERKAEATTAHHRLRRLPEVPATLESAQ